MKNWLTGIFGILLMVGLLTSCAPDRISTPPFAGPNQSPEPPNNNPDSTGPGLYADNPVITMSTPAPSTGGSPGGGCPDCNSIPEPSIPIPNAIIRSYAGVFSPEIPVIVTISAMPKAAAVFKSATASPADLSVPAATPPLVLLGVPGSLADTLALSLSVMPNAVGVIEVGVYVDEGAATGVYSIEAVQDSIHESLTVTVQ